MPRRCQTPRSVLPSEPNFGMYGQNRPRPNSNERRRQHEQGEDHRDDDADGAGDTERAVAVELGEERG